MVCGTPSTNSPAEACARAVPVAQISPQLWAETHCCETVAPSTFRCYDWIPRSTVTADPHTREINKYLNLCAHANQPVGLFGPGPDKNEKEKGIGKSAQRSTLIRFATKTQPRELKKRIVDFPGFGLSSTARTWKNPNIPSDVFSRPEPCAHFDRDPGGAGRETRPGGSPLDRRRHRAR